MLNLDLVLKEQLRVGNSNATYCYMVRNSRTFLWNIKTFFGLQNHTGHQDAKTLEEWTAIFKNAGFMIVDIKKDAWPWIKWRRWFTANLFINYYQLRNTPIPLKNTFEFIFILKKNHGVG